MTRRWAAIARLVPHAGFGPAAAAIAHSLVTGLLPIAFIFCTSSMLAALPDSAHPHAWVAPAGLAMAALLAQQVLAPFQAALAELVTRRVDERCLNRVVTSAVADTPMAALQRPEVMDRLGDVNAAFEGAAPTPGAAVAGAIALVTRYVQLLGAVLLVGVELSPVAGLVAAATALIVRVAQRGSLARFATAWTGMAAARRKINYLLDVGLGAADAKELRVLGLLPWLRARHRADSRAYLAPMWARRRRIYFRPFVGYSLIALTGGGLTMVLLERAAVAGRVDLRALSIAVQCLLVAMRFGVFFPESDIKTQHGFETQRAILEFERYAVPPASLPEVTGGEVAAPRRSITFERVVFAYDEAPVPVLDGCDLEITAGRSTAIVGFNGAGKTTLIKLLARLHDPQRGRVTVDGRDLRDLDVRAWRRRLAVIFQDFLRYDLTAADNIRMGAPDLPRDDAALLGAAERAGALELIERLPAGLDTPLSSRYRGGQDLSGGQWQRIALARALYAVHAGASVLVMDEPTAHFDVRAETRFFDRFLELTEGLTTVLVAHRFSTVRHADRIVVLDGGRVVESGDHDGLVGLGGRYAKLFALQAERFAR
ncbi:ABC transporter ATP-binding protein [Actinoallomurus rhizosphaericola]|uniref:ABC transporter ATP-binding protein n=1 Tax=Actinoallomurus rhizosphaericola TaxID=2952536 RepID=UPI002091D900|nr:ATP-binding cassette domain-containing protein [Actinoallomurus rhizosphaericola]MCO5993882.1 ABC transporter ATP-binding protein/permease [Actinoallomurus rhizosphaericola]